MNVTYLFNSIPFVYWTPIISHQCFNAPQGPHQLELHLGFPYMILETLEFALPNPAANWGKHELTA